MLRSITTKSYKNLNALGRRLFEIDHTKGSSSLNQLTVGYETTVLRGANLEKHQLFDSVEICDPNRAKLIVGRDKGTEFFDFC